MSAARSAYEQLLTWIADDDEIRSVEIDIRAESRSYDEDDQPLPDTYSFEIKAHDIELYAQDDNLTGMTSIVYHGMGATIEGAATIVVDSIAARQLTEAPDTDGVINDLVDLLHEIGAPNTALSAHIRERIANLCERSHDD